MSGGGGLVLELGFPGGTVNHLTTSSVVSLPFSPHLPPSVPHPLSLSPFVILLMAGFGEPAAWEMKAVGTFGLQKF